MDPSGHTHRWTKCNDDSVSIARRARSVTKARSSGWSRLDHPSKVCSKVPGASPKSLSSCSSHTTRPVARSQDQKPASTPAELLARSLPAIKWQPVRRWETNGIPLPACPSRSTFRYGLSSTTAEAVGSYVDKHMLAWSRDVDDQDLLVHS